MRACIISVGTSAGDHATVVAYGTAKTPRGVYIVVYTSKPQRLDIAWSMVCTRSTGAGSRSRRGHMYTFTPAWWRGTPPPTRRPGPWGMQNISWFPMLNPDSCAVSASVSLTKSGSLRVELLNIRRS
jgi:hypothetical protein